jgi:hypothetical protein
MIRGAPPERTLISALFGLTLPILLGSHIPMWKRFQVRRNFRMDAQTN